VGTAPGSYVNLPDRELRLHYRDWGGEGPDLLLLHGLSSNSRIWDLTAPLLTSTYRVIALDLRGHGLSDVTEDGYDFPSVTADVALFLDNFGLARVAVAGHSWGATVALALAADHPDRVSGVALVDGGLVELARYSDWETAEKHMTPPDIPGVPVERFLGFARQWPHLKDNWTDDLGEMVLSNFEIREDRVYRRLDIPRHMLIARAIYDSRPSEMWGRIKCPLLAIVATMEPSNEAEERWQGYRQDGIDALTSSKPDAQILVMENTIHDVPVQRPRELADALNAFAAELT
jgi:pimeloyl-ACP methyl ester carboxylesterase